MVDKVLFSSETTEWETPWDLFDELDKEFDFNIDAAASDENTKVRAYYFTEEIDGLKQPWHMNIDVGYGIRVDGRVWCNPPYGRQVGQWVAKADQEFRSGRSEVIVMLLPARTDVAWFHDYIYEKHDVEIRLIRGRLKFGGSKNSAPFPSLLAIWDRRNL